MIPPTEPQEDRIPVLLVDDNLMFLHILSDLVNGHPSMKVIGKARSGEQAFEAARKLLPRVIVFDRDMQVFSNPQAIAYLKTRSPGAILIGLTLIADEQSLILEASYGVDLVLKKSCVGSHLALSIGALSQRNLTPECCEQPLFMEK